MHSLNVGSTILKVRGKCAALSIPTEKKMNCAMVRELPGECFTPNSAGTIAESTVQPADQTAEID